MRSTSTIAWKASPTRTPPPICTSAPFPKPRWSQDRGRREQFRNTRCAAARNAFDSTRSRPIPAQRVHRHRDASETRKQVFESPHEIARTKRAVTIREVLQKKIYKSFKQEASNRFFETLHPAMGISDYRDKDFRVSFGRVTLARCDCEVPVRNSILTAWHKAFLHFAAEFQVRQNCHLVKLRNEDLRARVQTSVQMHCKKETARSRPGCFTMWQFRFAHSSERAQTSDRLTCRASQSDA